MSVPTPNVTNMTNIIGLRTFVYSVPNYLIIQGTDFTNTVTITLAPDAGTMWDPLDRNEQPVERVTDIFGNPLYDEVWFLSTPDAKAVAVQTGNGVSYRYPKLDPIDKVVGPVDLKVTVTNEDPPGTPTEKNDTKPIQVKYKPFFG